MQFGLGRLVAFCGARMVAGQDNPNHRLIRLVEGVKLQDLRSFGIKTPVLNTERLLEGFFYDDSLTMVFPGDCSDYTIQAVVLPDVVQIIEHAGILKKNDKDDQLLIIPKDTEITSVIDGQRYTNSLDFTKVERTGRSYDSGDRWGDDPRAGYHR